MPFLAINQNFSAERIKIKRFGLRVFSVYLIFYFLFISDVVFYFTPYLNWLNTPLRHVSKSLIKFVNTLFLKRQFDGNLYYSDTSWVYISALCFFIIASIAAAVWTTLEKEKNKSTLFKYVHAYARYYLAFLLFLYGIDKLFGNQFPPPGPTSLITRVGDLDPHSLLWTFMGSSASYNFFTGIMEIIPGVFLLFRRTCTLGALIALPVLINVLVLDIGYDTLVKVLVFHLILISIFILIPDFKRLVQFFLLKRDSTLSNIVPIIENQKLKRVGYILKFTVIGFVIFSLIKNEIRLTDAFYNPTYKSIVGIHQITEFYSNNNNWEWNKLAINTTPFLAIQFTNDSIAQYSFKADTAENVVELSIWNDSTFESKLHYKKLKNEEWLFEGTFKNDSVRFISNKVNIDKINLFKSKGKIHWVWY